MSGHSRSLPGRPSLRYLKVEAKRRLAAGEFPSLDDAQLAIAREHGQSSWAGLKRLIESQVSPRHDARRHLQWIASRFGPAGTPGWVPPADGELRQHFHEQFLRALPPERLREILASLGPRLGEGLDLVEDTATHALVQLGTGQLQAVADAGEPHRLVGLRAYNTGDVSDSRLAAPATHTSGEVPAAAVSVAERAFSELGLAGLALASGDASGAVWALARGWASLDPARPLTVRHRFPAASVTKLVTAVAVLRLAAESRISLDAPVNPQLATVRLADPAVTVRELLSHTGGVDGPGELLADSVPDIVSVFGSVIPCGRERGRYAYSNGGYAALGQLIADITQSPYAEAVTRLVLGPLGMSDSSFPDRWPGTPQAVTGYAPAPGGRLEPVPSHVCTIPAAGGLWTTISDLVRFGLTWRTLLPGKLVSEALTPQAELPAGSHIGLGWLLDRTGEIAGHPGGRPGASASLAVRLRDQRVHAALANRGVPVEPINGRVLRALS